MSDNVRIFLMSFIPAAAPGLLMLLFALMFYGTKK